MEFHGNFQEILGNYPEKDLTNKANVLDSLEKQLQDQRISTNHPKFNDQLLPCFRLML